MITHSLFRHLLCDMHSLERYRAGQCVTTDDIKRSLLLIERRYNYRIPDHYYRLALERSFTYCPQKHKKIECLQEIFTKGLTALAEDYLEVREKRIYVRAEKFNEWQAVLSCMPPLILIAAKLWNTFGIDRTQPLSSYLHDYILPNTSYTALLSPHIRQLEDLKKRNKGLQDLHLHLNGALETDTVWQDLLMYPEQIQQTIANYVQNPKVKELYDQISPTLATPNELYQLMHIAATLRCIIFEHIAGNCQQQQGYDDLCKALKLLLAGTFPSHNPSSTHPVETLLQISGNPVHYECLMYVLVFDTLYTHHSEKLASLFHFYLLILGLNNLLMVQHWQHFGFEEFQKYTLNGLREFSEQHYNRRFNQLAGNDLNHIGLLEGRFSPKDNCHKNVELIAEITQGWETLKNSIFLQHPEAPLPTLKLIAHFIKKPDTKPDCYIRHKALRSDVRQRAEVLRLMKENNDQYAQKITGIDAAASEFDAPPEVFAEGFRMLRCAGFRHFTYHAGEDFFHVLSGMRAIYEAVTYLDLRRGDRIGHASACGISVALWRENLGEKILLRRGDYLDDLIFARVLITELKLRELYEFIPLLNDRISTLCAKIYCENYDTDTLTESWRMRGRNPEELLSQDCQKLNRAERIYLQYHCRKTVERYNTIETFDIYEILGEQELVQLQQAMLRWMAEREIVIETLPTSNVVIGHHHGHNSYHLYNWLRWKQEGHLIPPIVVGTDDAGIFATNIYNEYCSIYCNFLYDKKMCTTDIIRFLEELDYNARLYNFGND